LAKIGWKCPPANELDGSMITSDFYMAKYFLCFETPMQTKIYKLSFTYLLVIFCGSGKKFSVYEIDSHFF